jgi:hypothetical protein
MAGSTLARMSAVLPLAFAVLVGCGPTVSTTSRRLSSGKEIDVVSIGVHDDAWDLEYCTHLPFSPREPLTCEAAAVWQGMAEEASASGASRAYIYATSCKRELKFVGWRPVVMANKSTGFRLLKDGNGTWQKSGGWGRVVCKE